MKGGKAPGEGVMPLQLVEKCLFEECLFEECLVDKAIARMEIEKLIKDRAVASSAYEPWE